jgi:hypothetical protein
MITNRNIPIEPTEASTLARKIQDMIGRPSDCNFIHLVENNLLKDCPITRQDITAVNNIFGPYLRSLKGKKIRRSERHVKAVHYEIPQYGMEQYRDVTLCTDIMFVNGIPFLMTISRDVKFGTAKALTSRSKKFILSGIKNVCCIYAYRGFRITAAHGDGEYKLMTGDFWCNMPTSKKRRKN